MQDEDQYHDLAKLLPGYNCGECGYKNCRDFAQAVLVGIDQTSDTALDLDLDLCPYLNQDRFQKNRSEIEELLPLLKGEVEEIIGVIDGLRADFALAPLTGEPSCREDLVPFDHGAQFKQGDVLRYRPLGCPVTHFGQVLKIDHGLVTVHMVGPRHLLGDDEFSYKDVGVCLVAAFEGTVCKGRVPEVGETVSFLPHHCMMQKVHSGVIVHSEGKMVRIESIDLKVW
jgi:uncharacterized Fe-S cluster-containing protein